MEYLYHKVRAQGYGYEAEKPIVVDRRIDVYDFLKNLCLDGMPNTRSFVREIKPAEVGFLRSKGLRAYDVDFEQFINENQRAVLTYTLFFYIKNIGFTGGSRLWCEEPDLSRFIGKEPEGLRLKYHTISKIKTQGEEDEKRDCKEDDNSVCPKDAGAGFIKREADNDYKYDKGVKFNRGFL